MRIIVIGFMGVGKTTVGRELSKRLNLNFIDMDREIERREDKTIAEIFEAYGESHFRMLETNLLKELVQEDNIVISTGGGVVTIEENFNILKNEKSVIFLDADTKNIISHLSEEIDKRPLLRDSNNLEKTIGDLLNKRYGKYNSVYDSKIDVNEKNVEEVVGQILVNIR